MRHEHSAGIVLARAGRFLLLRYQRGYWDLPKGHLEGAETPLEAATRELAEETGIKDAKLIPFERTISYKFKNHLGVMVDKKVTFFLASTQTEQVKLSDEHTASAWLPYDEAIKRATYKNAKEVLKAAKEALHVH